ncbi:MAG TPA: hypothetical protein VIX38_04585 [Nitrososphaeraceae archaeon]
MERIDSINKKSLVDPLPYEVDELVRKMYNHILKDGCIHCKHILQDNNNNNNNKNNEAGYQPAPTQNAATHHTQQASQEMKYYSG